MKIAAMLNVVSPHQLPLAKELVKLVGEDNCRYVYVDRAHGDRVKLGWGDGALPTWCIPMSGNENVVKDADLLYSGVRNIELFERRAKSGKATFYYSERWFKPLLTVRLFGLFDCSISGRVRMLFPAYRKMAQRFVKWLNADSNSRYFAVGPWAAKDMQWLGVKLDKIVPWGYYVEPSKLDGRALPAEKPQGVVRLLWVGRLLGLKRVDDIVRAVRAHNRLKRMDDSLPKVTLDIYGDGVEKPKLQRMVTKYGLDDLIKFHPAVPIEEVRKLMREHDIYVLASDAYEGWGAVVSEALEEEMRVVGTYESGSCASILPESNLYHAGDWRRLAELIRGDVPKIDIGQWTAKVAAERMVAMCTK